MNIQKPAAGIIATASLLVSVCAPQAVLAQATTTASSSASYVAPQDIEAQVRDYFADIPVMINIASCESSFTQFNPSGTVLHGGTGTMIGIFQISSILHAKDALFMGDNINTIEGNMAYARYLYDEYGTSPWLASKWCWKNKPLQLVPDAPKAALSAAISTTTATTTSSQSDDQAVASLRVQVAALQAILIQMQSQKSPVVATVSR